MRALKPFVIVILFCCAILFAACDSRRTGEPGVLADFKHSLATDNIVLFVIDTLRADHLPCYGYARETAPFLCSIAAEGVLFRNALSPSSATAPAMASIFTSTYPAEHGVVAGKMAFRRVVKKSNTMTINSIPPSLKKLPQHFHELGYRTYGVSDNFQISAELGFTNGFEEFQGFKNMGADVVNARLREWQPKISAGGKYFLYVHYMDPHYPYLLRNPWFDASSDKRQSIVDAYDTEIRHVDNALRELFELFKFQDNALVIILSDHGEEFWEHGRLGHGKNVYTTTTHVPFILLHRRLKSAQIAEWVGTIDLLPTLADLLGFKSEKHWRGRSLQPLLSGEQHHDFPNYSELLRLNEDRRAEYRSIIKRQHHLIRKLEKGGQASTELFNLLRDPGQKNDLFLTDKAVSKDLENTLDSYISSMQMFAEQKKTVEIDAETLKSLETLGYLQ